MKTDIKIKYSDSFGTVHSRDYYKGKSFHYAGEWTAGSHYFSDDYNIDFIAKDNCLLACSQSHYATVDNEPKNFLYDEKGFPNGISSRYWDFVLSGISGHSPGIKIINKYWYICDDISLPPAEQVWTNTGIKASFEFSDLTPQEIALLQRPGLEMMQYFIENVITQSLGQNENKVISQKVVTDNLNAKADKTTTVTNVSYSNKKFKKTINNQITDIVDIPTIKSDLELNKSDVGLSNVDNTSDLNKPISNATQVALDTKLNVTEFRDKELVLSAALNNLNRRKQIHYNTTEYWNSQVGFIPDAGDIIIYSNYKTVTVNNETKDVPGIKIGSGNGYVQDLAFIDDKLTIDFLNHINNSIIHTTAAEKDFWNNKINVDDYSEVVEETLIFNRN